MSESKTTKKKTSKKQEKQIPKTVWEVLSQVNCNEHTEVKGTGKFKATYLSWSWAWGILMNYYPNATFENHYNEDGYPCFFDQNGNAMVRVTLHIGEQSHTEDFMVTDYNNKAIKNPDSFAINTALKRCLVKSMAYFGLGHYIYAGEDLPKVDFDRKAALAAIDDYVKNNAPEFEGKVLSYYGEDSLNDLNDAQLEVVLSKVPVTSEEK